MIVYVLLQKRDEWVNITGVYYDREFAEAKKQEREEAELEWTMYDRFEYSIVERDVFKLIQESL